jgi:hypothetical protein
MMSVFAAQPFLAAPVFHFRKSNLYARVFALCFHRRGTPPLFARQTPVRAPGGL